jgi:hypothetical protein
MMFKRNKKIDHFRKCVAQNTSVVYDRHNDRLAPFK